MPSTSLPHGTVPLLVIRTTEVQSDICTEVQRPVFPSSPLPWVPWQTIWDYNRELETLIIVCEPNGKLFIGEKASIIYSLCNDTEESRNSHTDQEKSDQKREQGTDDSIYINSRKCKLS